MAPTSTKTPPAGICARKKSSSSMIVVGIEQRAALGGAGLMVEAKRGALIVHVDRARAQQIDQPRQHGPKRAALQPRAMRQRNDRGLRGIRCERAERRGRRVVVGRQTMVLGESGACIAGFVGGEIQWLVESDRLIGRRTPRRRGIQYAAAYRFNHCCLWNTGSPALRGLTTTEYVLRVLAARCARGLQIRSSLENQRAQGRPGARCTRGLACKMHKEKRTRAYRFSGDTPAFPAQWFYGLYVLSPVTGLSCHRRSLRSVSLSRT